MKNKNLLLVLSSFVLVSNLSITLMKHTNQDMKINVDN